MNHYLQNVTGLSSLAAPSERKEWKIVSSNYIMKLNLMQKVKKLKLWKLFH